MTSGPQTAEAVPPTLSAAEGAVAPSSGYLSSLAQSVSQAYQSAKSQGLTAAGSAKDWLVSEVGSGSRWEYKIVSLDNRDSAVVEKSLNELGAAGWQCFHVQATDSATTFYMQRRSFSIIQSIPMSDLLKVIPYLGFGQGEK